MLVDPHCIFCKIVAGEAEASVVYQDQYVTVFMDIRPVVQGHTLVVPNIHSPDLSSLDQAHAQHMFTTAQNIAQAIRASELNCEGINLFMADGSAAGQTVLHNHLHIIPRYIGDGFSPRFHISYVEPQSREELNQVADQISESLRKDDAFVKGNSGGIR